MAALTPGTLALRDSSAEACDEKAHWQATPAEGSTGGFLFRVSDEGPEAGHQVTVTFPQEPAEGERVCTPVRLRLTPRGLSESGAPVLTNPLEAGEYTWSIDFIGAPFGSGLLSRGEGQIAIGQEGPLER